MSTCEIPDGSALEQRTPNREHWVRVAVPVCLLVLAQLPLLVLYGAMLWSRPHYRFFPLVLVGAAGLAFAEIRGVGPCRPGTRGFSLGLVGLSWLLLATGILLYIPWFGAVAGLVTVLAVIHGIGGGRLVVTLLPAWVFLWMAVRPPLGHDLALIYRLQSLVSSLSSPILDLLGVAHYMQGNVVVIVGRKMMIEEACSGIQSLLPVLCCIMFLIFWTRPPVIRGIVLVLASVFWVVVCNVARVVSVVAMDAFWHFDATTGWRHEALGIVAFGVILILITSTDQLLRFLGASLRLWAGLVAAWARGRLQSARWNPLDPLVPEEPSFAQPPWLAASIGAPGLRTAQRPAGFPAPPDLRKTWLGSWPVLGVYGLLGLAELVLNGPSVYEDLFGRVQFVKACAALHEETLPARWGSFRRQRFEVERREADNFLGKYSRTWYFEWRGKQVLVSVDYPFAGWHELTICYKSQGWTLLGTRVGQGDASDWVGRGPVVEAKLANAQREHGNLIFCFCDRQGGFGGSRAPDRYSNLGNFLRDKLLGDLSPLFGKGTRTCYQFQLLVQSEDPISPAEEDEARSFFDHVRSVVWRASFGGEGGAQ